uniref:Uncharacterized protein n=1 Tax=Aeromonas hydrophila TaxID=644 RepID=Q6TP13_AERHY|nr:unknown [Aeromonas hydrophila]
MLEHLCNLKSSVPVVKTILPDKRGACLIACSSDALGWLTQMIRYAESSSFSQQRLLDTDSSKFERLITSHTK